MFVLQFKNPVDHTSASLLVLVSPGFKVSWSQLKQLSLLTYYMVSNTLWTFSALKLTNVFLCWFFLVLVAQLATLTKINLSTVLQLFIYLFIRSSWSLPGPQVLVSAIRSIEGFGSGQRVSEIMSVLLLRVGESHSVCAAVASAVCATLERRQLNQLLLRQGSQTGKTC